ncbi:MAG: RNA methyltransferase [Saprospiraceae bacterium]|nr:RNA methyltransferase [Saprospiraceae bacterium]
MRKLKMDELGRMSTDDFQATQKLPIVLILDNIRSALNVGSIFRTADAFALEKIYLCGITATPPHREILKTALGSTETVSWEYISDTIDAVLEVQSQGFQVWAVEQTSGSELLQKIDIQDSMKYSLVLGNEVDGVDDEVLKHCGKSIEIPQFGTKHSLNVAVCAGIVTWEFVSKLKFQEK